MYELASPHLMFQLFKIRKMIEGKTRLPFELEVNNACSQEIHICCCWWDQVGKRSLHFHVLSGETGMGMRVKSLTPVPWCTSKLDSPAIAFYKVSWLAPRHGIQKCIQSQLVWLLCSMFWGKTFFNIVWGRKERRERGCSCIYIYVLLSFDK